MYPGKEGTELIRVRQFIASSSQLIHAPTKGSGYFQCVQCSLRSAFQIPSQVLLIPFAVMIVLNPFVNIMNFQEYQILKST